MARLANSRGGRFAVCLLFALAAGDLGAWTPPESSGDGWQGVVEFGANRKRGNVRSETASAALRLSLVHRRLETEIESEWYSSRVRFSRDLRDASGELVRDENGDARTERVSVRTHARIGADLGLRWFATPRRYALVSLDAEHDRPADVRYRIRPVVGGGYKLWRDDADFFAAEAGIGRAWLDTGEARLGSTIAYVGLRFKRRLDDRTRLDASVDSDLSLDDANARIKLALTFRISSRVSLTLRHTEARERASIDDQGRTATRTSGDTTANIEIDLFESR